MAYYISFKNCLLGGYFTSRYLRRLKYPDLFLMPFYAPDLSQQPRIDFVNPNEYSLEFTKSRVFKNDTLSYLFKYGQ